MSSVGAPLGLQKLSFNPLKVMMQTLKPGTSFTGLTKDEVAKAVETFFTGELPEQPIALVAKSADKKGDKDDKKDDDQKDQKDQDKKPPADDDSNEGTDDEDSNGEDSDAEGFQIFVTLPWTGKTITLDVEASYTIHTVKALVYEKERVPRSQQRLDYEYHHNMDNLKSLQDYNIGDGAFVMCRLSIVGAGKRPRGTEAAVAKTARLQQLTEDINGLEGSLDIAVLNNTATMMHQISQTLAVIDSPADMIDLLKNMSIDALAKVSEDVTFKSGTATGHLNQAADILFVDAATALDDLGTQLKTLKSLIRKKFEKRYTSQYYVEGEFRNSQFKGSVDAILNLLRQAAAAASASAPAPVAM